MDTQPQMKDILDDDIEACFDGSIAHGFSSVWDFPTGETYIVIFVLERNGNMYEVQLTANDPEQEVTFVELINSWEWTDAGGPPTDLDDQFAATDFKVIGMATEVDKSIPGRPNPATFQSVFPATSEKIHVIYELDDGIEDMVTISWSRDGRQLFVANPFDYTTTSFAWGWITRPAGGEFVTGSYQVTLTLENSGDSITVPFTVE